MDTELFLIFHILVRGGAKELFPYLTEYRTLLRVKKSNKPNYILYQKILRKYCQTPWAKKYVMSSNLGLYLGIEHSSEFLGLIKVNMSKNHSSLLFLESISEE